MKKQRYAELVVESFDNCVGLTKQHRHHFVGLSSLKAPKHFTITAINYKEKLVTLGQAKGFYKKARQVAADNPGALFCRCGIASLQQTEVLQLVSMLYEIAHGASPNLSQGKPAEYYNKPQNKLAWEARLLDRKFHGSSYYQDYRGKIFGKANHSKQVSYPRFRIND
jgi:hypothetical protein